MAENKIQSAFSAGEVSPSLFGRVDLQQYSKGCSTMRNFFVNYRGGASSRAGLAYVGMCKQGATWLPGNSSITTNPPRDIRFQFNINQGYALEFGDQYMRIKSNGAYVTETNVVVSSVSSAALFTTGTPHGYSVGDWVFDTGNTGFNGLVWVVNTVPSSSTFTVTDLFGNVISAATASTIGTMARIYTVIAPYAAIDLPFLKFTQSADTMSLCCVNQQTFTEYPTYELTRFAATNWTFVQTSFAANILPPVGVTATAQSSTTLNTWYSYVVTAVDASTGQESVASAVVNVENNDIAINAGSNTIAWDAVANAGSYNVYKATPSYTIPVPVGSLYGFAGRALGTSFTDNNITADFTGVPPVHTDPFARGTIAGVTITSAGSGYTQGTIGYSIGTSTGAGFVGTPIANNGSVAGVIIQNGGSGYQPGDTITILGGGSAVAATGTMTFIMNPPTGGDPSNIILDGITWTFVASGATGNQTNVGMSLAATLNQLTSDLNASTDPNISLATYTNSLTVLTITYDSVGTGGNSYTLGAGTAASAVSGPTLTGGTNVGGATANLIIGAESGTYPGTVAYFQQRRVYAYTIDEPDTYFFSKPGAFYNMDSSIPTTDSDAFTGAPWAQQVNGIQSLVPVQTGLIVLTGNGAWLLNGGTSAAITASDQTATAQAYNGCHYHIQPIVINYDILYVQAKGSIVRDLSFNFYVNVFTGADKTVLSNHLFNFHQLQQWAYAEEPYKVIWSVRDDGILLSLTFLKEQEVEGWARHDTNGFFVSVTSVTEPPVDAVYVITKRYIQGPAVWAYYSERMDNRNWQDVEDCFCVDAGLSYPMTFPNATLTPAATNGTANISSVNLISGGSGYTAPIVTVLDPTGLGAGALFSVTLLGGVITAITPTSQGQNYAAGSTLVINDATGRDANAQPIITNNVIFNASSGVFNSGMIGDVIRIGNNNANITNTNITANGGGKAIITSYVSGTQVVANIIETITNIVPDDPFNTPSPVIANQWSLSVPTTVVTGLNHLEGMSVAILADGSVVPNQIVTNNEITLPLAASSIVIGLPYICQLQALYLDVPAQGGTIQGKRKNVQAVTTRVENSRGLQIGTNQPDQSTQPNNATVPWINMFEFDERDASIYPGNAIPLITGDERTLVQGQWNKYGQIAAQQIYPLPAQILAFLPEFSMGDNLGGA